MTAELSVYPLLALTLAASLGGGLVKSYYSKRVSASSGGYYLYNGVSSLVSAAVLTVMGRSHAVSAFTLSLGVLFGAVTAVQQVTNAAALAVGPWSYTSVLISLSTVIPALSGAIFWHEKLTPAGIAGIALLAVCILLSVNKKKDGKSASPKWFALSMSAALCTGIIGKGIRQQLQRGREHQLLPQRQLVSQRRALRLSYHRICLFGCIFVYPFRTLREEGQEKRGKDRPRPPAAASCSNVRGCGDRGGVKQRNKPPPCWNDEQCRVFPGSKRRRARADDRSGGHFLS